MLQDGHVTKKWKGTEEKSKVAKNSIQKGLGVILNYHKVGWPVLKRY